MPPKQAPSPITIFKTENESLIQNPYRLITRNEILEKDNKDLRKRLNECNKVFEDREWDEPFNEDRD